MCDDILIIVYNITKFINLYDIAFIYIVIKLVVKLILVILVYFGTKNISNEKIVAQTCKSSDSFNIVLFFNNELFLD